MHATPTIAGLMAPILADAPITHRLDVTFGDVTVVISSNSKGLIEKLANYYRDFIGGGGATLIPVTAIEAGPPDFELPLAVKQREPGKTKLKESYCDLPDGRVVKKLLTGLLFLFGHGDNYAVGPCIDNDNQVVNFINNRFIEHCLKRGALLFHAAGVAEGGAGLVISGFSGAGKSTLALEIMRHGTDFVSNDRVMVSHAGGHLDLGVSFLGGKYLATYARQGSGASWDTTTRTGGRYVPHEPSQEIIALAHKAQALFPDMAFTCVDVVETPDGAAIYEVSAFGGFRGLLDACGLDAAAAYADYVLEQIR